MSSISETSSWIKFFTDAGIPASDATNYALLFADNRIKQHMLLDLNRECLRDMGITVMGDVIAILKHAKTAARVRALADHGMPKLTSSSSAKNGVKAGPAMSKQNTPASRMLEHYVRKEAPAHSPPAALSGRLGTINIVSSSSSGGGGKRSSVFERLGDNSVSSTTSDASLDNSTHEQNGGSLEYHGVLKYSSKESNERAKTISKSKISTAKPDISISSSTLKSRLGMPGSSVTRVPALKSAGIFAMETDATSRRVIAKSVVSVRPLKRHREEEEIDSSTGIASRIGIKSQSMSSLPSTRTILKPVRSKTHDRYLHRSDDSELSSDDHHQIVSKPAGSKMYMDHVAKSKVIVSRGYSGRTHSEEDDSPYETLPKRKKISKTLTDSDRRRIVTPGHFVADHPLNVRRQGSSSGHTDDAVPSMRIKTSSTLSKIRNRNSLAVLSKKKKKHLEVLEPIRIKVSQKVPTKTKSKSQQIYISDDSETADSSSQDIRRVVRSSDSSSSNNSDSDSSAAAAATNTYKVRKITLLYNFFLWLKCE